MTDVKMTLIEIVKGTYGTTVVIGHRPDEDPVKIAYDEISISPEAEVTVLGELEGHFAPVGRHFAWKAKEILLKQSEDAKAVKQ
jgi:hypothetical protein